VPDHLSDEQQKAVDELQHTFGEDPRAGLFGNGAPGSSQPAGDASAGGER
jgi:hypothetical protein